MVADPRNKYRVAEHPHRIRITQRTKITEITPEPENFPLYAYNAKPIDILQSRQGDNTFLSDIVGVVTRLTDIIPSKEGQEQRRNIYIKDASNKTAIVTLWGDHADNFDPQAVHGASSEHNVFILFVAITVGQFQGMVAFKSTSLTCWYINIPIPEMDALQEKLRGERYMIGWQDHENPRSEPVETTLGALAREEVGAIIGKRYKLNIVIREVNNPHDWWFYSCKACWKGMTPVGNSYKCSRCHRTQKEQRYKLSIKATDIESSKESTPMIGRFMFFGESGTALTGREAALLALTTRGRPNYIPSAIADTVGKKCAVLAEVKQDTLDADEGTIVFSVSKVEPINTPAPAEPLSSRSGDAAITESSALINPSGDTQNRSDDNMSPQTTPVKDVIDSADTEIEEDTSSIAEGKKRKNTTPSDRTPKKSGAADKKGPGKQLFQSKKKK